MTQTLTTERLREILERRSPSLRWGEAEKIAAELLANREAQPVACDIERIKRHALPAGECPKQSQVVLLSSLQRLLTAPPAPAVVKLPTEFYSDEGVVVRLEEVMAALALVGVKYERKSNACRAAMLAQPVSHGCKLVPVEPTAEMIQSGIAAHYERQQLQIHDRPAPGPMECAYIAMLAAAPEGGNDA